MPRTAAAMRRPKPAAGSLSNEFSAAGQAPMAGAGRGPQLGAVRVLRVGYYEVGEGFCPYLWGHPDIRY